MLWHNVISTLCTVGFGASITGINLVNYKKSPEYKWHDSTTPPRIIAACLIKGVIYSVLAPFPILDIALNWGNKDKFNRHLIPLSVYGYRGDIFPGKE